MALVERVIVAVPFTTVSTPYTAHLQEENGIPPRERDTPRPRRENEQRTDPPQIYDTLMDRTHSNETKEVRRKLAGSAYAVYSDGSMPIVFWSRDFVQNADNWDHWDLTSDAGCGAKTTCDSGCVAVSGSSGNGVFHFAGEDTSQSTYSPAYWGWLLNDGATDSCVKTACSSTFQHIPSSSNPPDLSVAPYESSSTSEFITPTQMEFCYVHEYWKYWPETNGVSVKQPNLVAAFGKGMTHIRHSCAEITADECRDETEASAYGGHLFHIRKIVDSAICTDSPHEYYVCSSLTPSTYMNYKNGKAVNPYLAWHDYSTQYANVNDKVTTYIMDKGSMVLSGVVHNPSVNGRYEQSMSELCNNHPVYYCSSCGTKLVYVAGRGGYNNRYGGFYDTQLHTNGWAVFASSTPCNPDVTLALGSDVAPVQMYDTAETYNGNVWGAQYPNQAINYGTVAWVEFDGVSWQMNSENSIEVKRTSDYLSLECVVGSSQLSTSCAYNSGTQYCPKGGWYKSINHCTPEYCTLPNSYVNGNMGTCSSLKRTNDNPTSYLLGSGVSCDIACDSGYGAFSTTYTCAEGELIATATSCVETFCGVVGTMGEGVIGGGSTPCSESTSLSSASNPSCDLQCNDGYTSNGVDARYTCSVGDASPQSSFSCTRNQCNAIGSLGTGVVSNPSGANEGCTTSTQLLSLTSCDVMCDTSAGYDPGMGTFDCGSQGGSFLTSTLSCDLTITCDVTSPSNGSMGTCSSSLTAGASCEFNCNNGHTLSSVTSCDSSGSLTAGTCDPLPCSIVDAPTNGNLGNCPSSLASGASCTFLCNGGYEVVGETSCLAGTLTSVATCQESSCTNVSPPTNGEMGNCTSPLESGASCLFSCNEGYDLSGSSNCSLGVLYSATCDERSCSYNRPMHAVEGQGTCPSELESGSSCVFVCAQGYTASGSLTCNLGITNDATCEPSACDLNLPQNHSPGNCSSRLEHGEKCMLDCDMGYTLVGEYECSFGTVVSTASCVETPCTGITLPNEADWGTCAPDGTLSSGDSCTFSCGVGYSVSGSTSCESGTLTNIGSCLRNCSSLSDVVVGIPITFEVAPSSSNEAFLTASSVSHESDGEWEAQVVITNKDDGALDFVSSIEGELSSSTTSLTTPSHRAEHITIVVQSQTVYVSDPHIRVTYQISRSGTGSNMIDPVGMSIEMFLTHGSGDEQKTDCLYSSSSGGIATCTVSIPDVWFSDSQSTTCDVYMSLTYGDVSSTRTSNVESVNLYRRPVYGNVTQAGVWATLPQQPVYVGDTFQVYLYANTGGNTLAGFSIDVFYDDTLIAYTSTSASSPYSVTTGSSTPGQLSLVGVSPIDIAAETITSSDISLCVLSFSVRSDVTITNANVLTSQVVQMLSKSNLVYVSSEAVQMNDFDQSSFSGRLAIEQDDRLGVMTFTDKAELVNTAMLRSGNDPVSSTINVWGVYRKSPPSPVISGVTCTSRNTSVVKIRNVCDMYVDGTESGGAGSISIDVTDGTFSTLVHVRVWAPTFVSLSADDVYLGVLDGTQSCGSGVTREWASLTATATFRANSYTMVSDVDVTEYVTFVSDNVAVLAVDGTEGRASSVGSVLVTLASTSVQHNAMVVDVVDDVVSASMVTAVVSSVDMIQPTSLSNPFEDTLQITVSAIARQDMNFEGNVGAVIAFVTLNGTVVKKLNSQDHNVNVDVYSPYLSLSSSSTTLPNSVVVSGGASNSCGDFVGVTWLDLCDSSIVFSNATVLMDLPMATGGSVTLAGGDKITYASSPAALVGVPTVLTYAATISFEDGSQMSATSDDRLTVDVTSMTGGALVNASDGTIQVFGTNAGEVQIAINWPSLGTIETITIHVVVPTRLTMSVHPFPTFSGSSSITKSVLHQIEQTGKYQRGTIRALLDLSSGSSIDVTSQASLSVISNDTNVVQWSNGVLVPHVPGTAALSCSFGSTNLVDADKVALTVSDLSATISSIVISPFAANTLSLAVNSSTFLEIQAFFTDGTRFENAVNDVEWISVSEYLSFASSSETDVSTSADGSVIARQNSNDLLNITAVSSNAAGSVQFVSNLLALNGDVDLGDRTGLAFPDALQRGSNVYDMSVRVNSYGNPLKQFEIIVVFDSNVIQATAVHVGNDWPSDIVSTINSPTTEVRVAGVFYDSSASGTDMEVARITFDAVGSASSSTPISCRIISLQTTDSVDLIAPNSNCVAGEGVLTLSAGRRRLIRGPVRLKRSIAKETPRRRDLSATEKYGDVNGDGTFNNADVFYAIRVLVGDVPISSLTPWQVQCLDADMNGGRELLDAQYLSYAAAKKYRFVSDTWSYFEEIDASNAYFVMGASILDQDSLNATAVSASNGETYVYFEVRLQNFMNLSNSVQCDANAVHALFSSSTWSPGAFVNTSDNGYVVRAQSVLDDGTFEARLPYVRSAMTCSFDASFVLMIETADVTGATDNQRAFPFYSTNYGRYGAEGFTQFTPFGAPNNSVIGPSLDTSTTESTSAQVTTTQAVEGTTEEDTTAPTVTTESTMTESATTAAASTTSETSMRTTETLPTSTTDSASAQATTTRSVKETTEEDTTAPTMTTESTATESTPTTTSLTTSDTSVRTTESTTSQVFTTPSVVVKTTVESATTRTVEGGTTAVVDDAEESSSADDKMMVYAIAGAIVVLILIVIVFVFIVCCCCRRRRKKSALANHKEIDMTSFTTMQTQQARYDSGRIASEDLTEIIDTVGKRPITRAETQSERGIVASDIDSDDVAMLKKISKVNMKKLSSDVNAVYTPDASMFTTPRADRDSDPLSTLDL